MPLGYRCDHLSPEQGSEDLMFLPIHCVQKELVHEDSADGQKDNHVTVQSYDEFHNIVTHQLPSTDDKNSTSGKPLTENFSSKHDLDMYVILSLVLLICINSFQFPQSTQFGGGIGDTIL